jgi:hypothetical protein
MAYLQHIAGTQQVLPPNVQDTLERDQRKLAVDKFLARAEIAMVSPSFAFDASICRTQPWMCHCTAEGLMPSCRPSSVWLASSGVLHALLFARSMCD